jgi:hypothetical protein
MEERGLAEVADRDHATRHPDVGCRGEAALVEPAEACVDLARAVVRTEVVRKTIRTALA